MSTRQDSTTLTPDRRAAQEGQQAVHQDIRLGVLIAPINKDHEGRIHRTVQHRQGRHVHIGLDVEHPAQHLLEVRRFHPRRPDEQGGQFELAVLPGHFGQQVGLPASRLRRDDQQRRLRSGPPLQLLFGLGTRLVEVGNDLPFPVKTGHHRLVPLREALGEDGFGHALGGNGRLLLLEANHGFEAFEHLAHGLAVAAVGTVENEALAAGELLVDEHAGIRIGSCHLPRQNEERHDLQPAPLIF